MGLSTVPQRGDRGGCRLSKRLIDERGRHYGPIADGLRRDAALATIYLAPKLKHGCSLDARDIAWLFVLVKARRDSTARKADNLDDAECFLEGARRVADGEVSDGFGSTWSRCGDGCTLAVVRPGEADCDQSGPACPLNN